MKKISALVLLVVAGAVVLSVVSGLDGVSAQTGDYDADNDGLIEITYLEQLNAIRWDVDGDGVVNQEEDADGYRTAFPGAVARMGCPQSGCDGYELVRSLDFDDAASYASGTVNTRWTSGAGWLPIGVGGVLFWTVFEGNNHTISNLFINRSGASDPGVAGLFGCTVGSDIRNVGLVDVDITAGDNVGGLVGYDSGSITSSYSTGSVSGNDNVGGLVGSGANTTLSYSTSSVSGNDNVGGLVGNSGDITFSYATGNVLGNYDVGGLVGYGLYITSSYATGDVSGNGSVGGLVGSGFYITSSYTTGNVLGRFSVGGLVGIIATTVSGSARDESIIASSYATGNVTGIDEIGGLVGYNKYASITFSYATGNVTGSGERSTGIGGLVGRNGSSITASYSIGSVSGNTKVGGLVGENHEQGSVIAGYWNTETSGQSRGVGTGSIDGVEGRTTADLQTPTGYTGIYIPWHFDFDNADNDFDTTTGRDDYWNFGTSSQYPALKVDFNRDGTATWQEFGDQRGDRPMSMITPVPTYTPTPMPIYTPTPAISPTPPPIFVPTSTPTPVANKDVLNRLSALEQLVAMLQNRLNTSEANVAALQNRVAVLEGGTPRPVVTPTATPTPRPGEPTPTPLPTATPKPPGELSPRAQEIDAAVKAYLESQGVFTTDHEIASACGYLRGSGWDFFGLPLSMPDRDYNIAAAVFLNTQGSSEIQRYCDEK